MTASRYAASCSKCVRNASIAEMTLSTSAVAAAAADSPWVATSSEPSLACSPRSVLTASFKSTQPGCSNSQDAAALAPETTAPEAAQVTRWSTA